MGSPLKRKLDYSDYAAAPDDGKRREIVQGELFVTPSPSPMHQRISRRLLLLLEHYFHGRSIGEVFDAPIDLILSKHDVLVPDLLVVSDPSLISKRGIEGPPLLIVEILSASTRKHDRVTKARRYAELGVEHYWIVDPEREQVTCHHLVNGTFQPLVEARGDATLRHPTWAGLEVDLSALWR